MKDKEFLESDILNEFLNENYLKIDNLNKIKKVFSNNFPKSIQLEDFFKKDKYVLLKNEIRNLRFKRKYLPDEFSICVSELSENFKMLFENKEFKSLLEFIIGRKIEDIIINSVKLKHKDYTLLKDEDNKDGFFEINFFFSYLWKEEYGGYFSYISGNEEVLRVLPKKNSISFVYVDTNIKGFVKYINSNSGKKSIYFYKTIIL